MRAISCSFRSVCWVSGCSLPSLGAISRLQNRSIFQNAPATLQSNMLVLQYGCNDCQNCQNLLSRVFSTRSLWTSRNLQNEVATSNWPEKACRFAHGQAFWVEIQISVFAFDAFCDLYYLKYVNCQCCFGFGGPNPQKNKETNKQKGIRVVMHSHRIKTTIAMSYCKCIGM